MTNANHERNIDAGQLRQAVVAASLAPARRFWVRA
jgi:hypothetical protein